MSAPDFKLLNVRLMRSRCRNHADFDFQENIKQLLRLVMPFEMGDYNAVLARCVALKRRPITMITGSL